MSLVPRAEERRVLAWVATFAAAAAGLTLAPFWAPLVLAAWLAILARPVFVRLTQRIGGRERAAGAIVVTLGMSLLVPLALTTVSLVQGALELGERLVKSQGAKDALVALASGEGGSTAQLPTSPSQIIALVREHGTQALQVASSIAGAAASAVVAFLIFFYAAFVFLVDGPDLYDWIRAHAPVEDRVVDRLAGAFAETGRGLLVGVGLTAALQAIVAAITYAAVGVPRALVLGFLTFLAAFLPAGTALVWFPIVVGLFLSGRTREAAILFAVAALVVGSIDNFLRPVFARVGHLQLPAFVLLLSMLGGFAAFGAWGLILGPLALRLAKEALALLREAREETADTSAAP